jgi:hypothetical protein
MTTKYTPGPWSVFAQPITGRGDAILEVVEQIMATEPMSDRFYLINADGKCPALTGCGPTSEANARLIAAAPELVEALRATLNALEKLDAGETKVAARARALLARIEGDAA